ncbi:MAG: SdrD B-like domain-containing protein, partial [Verrucomicrobiota bacterium]
MTSNRLIRFLILCASLCLFGSLGLETAEAQFQITGKVRLDADGDGDIVSDPVFEAPIVGVTVTLFVDADANLVADGPAVQVSVTDNNGCFTFTNLASQIYLIQQTDFTNLFSTGDSFGANDNNINVNLGTNSVSGLLFLDDKQDVSGGPFCGQCILVADAGGDGGGNDRLTILDTNNVESTIGAGTGTDNIEAMAIDPCMSNVTVWASNDRGAGQPADIGTIDLTTGVYNPTSILDPIVNGLIGGVPTAVLPRDIDGLSFDPFTCILYGSIRQPGANDLLIQLDINTGLVISNAFGLGMDYVEIPGTNFLGFPLNDIDDIAVDPEDGQMYGILNGGGATDVLVRIDKTDGSLQVVGLPFGPNDMEGLSFNNDGQLFSTTGNNGNPGDSIFFIDKTLGVTTSVINLDVPTDDGSDYEANDCLSCWPNRITGTVYFDDDGDAIYDLGSDIVYPGATVNLYRDVNGDGLFDPGDTFISSMITDSNGFYRFTFKGSGAYVLNVDTNTLPADAFLTTDNLEAADFGTNRFGITEINNNFGFAVPAMPIVKMSDGGGIVTNGQIITYTIDISNTGSLVISEIDVLDFLPSSMTYVTNSSFITAPTGVGRLATGRVADVFGNIAYTNENGSINWAGPWTETDGGGGGAVGGNVRITGNELVVENNGLIDRSVDLSCATQAIWSFTYREVDVLEPADQVNFQVSTDGVTFVTVGGFNDDLTGPASTNIDISAFISTNTTIRFEVLGFVAAAEEFRVDDLFIFRSGCGPGRATNTFAGSPPTTLITNMTLFPGEAASLTFMAQVTDPVATTGVVINVACYTASVFVEPVCSAVTDVVIAAISGTVHNDLDANGNPTEFGEPGISNVLITLLTNGVPIASTNTDANGFYIFTNLLPGTYTVVETDPAGFNSTTDVDGPNDNTINVMLAGADRNTNDFWDTRPFAAVGDYVWLDENSDGVQDAGEAGIANVSVILFDAGGTPIATTVTDTAGGYLFTDLIPGTYTVQVDTATLPAG